MDRYAYCTVQSKNIWMINYQLSISLEFSVWTQTLNNFLMNDNAKTWVVPQHCLETNRTNIFMDILATRETPSCWSVLQPREKTYSKYPFSFFYLADFLQEFQSLFKLPNTNHSGYFFISWHKACHINKQALKVLNLQASYKKSWISRHLIKSPDLQASYKKSYTKIGTKKIINMQLTN